MPLRDQLEVIGLQWSMHGSHLNALCNTESGLHLNNLTSPHPVRFLESIVYYDYSKVSKLFLELITVLFRLNESVRFLNSPGGPGSPWFIVWLQLWHIRVCVVWLNEPSVPGVDSPIYSLETV